MEAGKLDVEQYFRDKRQTEGDVFKALPKDIKHPNKILGQLVFIYEPGQRFHSSHIRIFDLDEEVVVVNKEDL